MNPAYRAGWIAFRALFRFYFGWRVYNPERVPLEGPVILASNHASYLDPPLVGSGLRRGINYLARENLFRFPVVGEVKIESKESAESNPPCAIGRIHRSA